METIYSVDYFISKFSAIPEKLWCTHTTDNGRGQHCAWGHCCYFTIEELAFGRLDKICMKVLPLTPMKRNYTDSNNGFANINNGGIKEYQQPTPKQRILAALYDIKKMQEPKPTYENISKSLAILPINETSDKTSTPKPLKQLQ